MGSHLMASSQLQKKKKKKTNLGSSLKKALKTFKTTKQNKAFTVKNNLTKYVVFSMVSD